MTSPPLTNREYAYLSVIGDGTHQEVTKIINIKPSLAWNPGEKSEQTGRIQKFMRWTLDSGLNDTEPLEKHFDAIFFRLKKRHKEIQALFFSGYDAYIQCAGYYPPSGHGTHLNREIIREAGKLNLAIDLDFYYIDSMGHDG
jgi:hypothetical protein